MACQLGWHACQHARPPDAQHRHLIASGPSHCEPQGVAVGMPALTSRNATSFELELNLHHCLLFTLNNISITHLFSVQDHVAQWEMLNCYHTGGLKILYLKENYCTLPKRTTDTISQKDIF